MNFQQGLSGLNSTSKNLEVIGNNVANANTYGSKSSRAEFADIYANALSGAGTGTVGIGVRLQTVAQQFTQGSISSTDNPLDIAINGNGFFQVTDTSGALLYTRNGQFKLDRDGYIINNAGQNLMGYAATPDGTIVPKAASKLQLPTNGIDPKGTTKVTMEMNLDSRMAAKDPTVAANSFDPTNAATYHNATSLTVYDAKGDAVPVTFYYVKTATTGTTDSWDVFATAGADNATDVFSSSLTPSSSGGKTPLARVTYTNGTNPTVSPNPVQTSILSSNINSTNGTTKSQDIANVAFDFASSTQWGSSFAITNMSQDGYTAGELASLKVENNGIITARYTNGQTKSAGQLELATFRNPQGLQPVGGNAWAATYTSGDPVVGTATSGTMGALQSGALEESNVDLTGELVNMMTAQRIYQANAQTIKTQDAVLQTLVSLR